MRQIGLTGWKTAMVLSVFAFGMVTFGQSSTARWDTLAIPQEATDTSKQTQEPAKSPPQDETKKKQDAPPQTPPAQARPDRAQGWRGSFRAGESRRRGRNQEQSAAPQKEAKESAPGSQSEKVEPAKEEKPKGEESAAEEPETKEAKPKEMAALALSPEWMNEFKWRSIGPANMSGRLTDIAVNPRDHNTWWIASASGGLLKTTNDGTTFEHQFDHEHTVSIGDVEVAPSNPDILWVGTGEANPRNSVSWGDGVYKSTDGGKTWTHMGLDKTFQIGEIQIDPNNPDIVYVGALGRLWGPNEERGLYKTTDGGKTWEKVFYVDDRTGVIDIDLKPDDPDTIIIATYERKRDGFDANDPEKKWGPGGGIYKSTDAGTTWMKTSDGVPSSHLGRVGIDWYAKDPNILYAVIESEHLGDEPENAAYMGVQGVDAEVGAKVTEIVEGSPGEKARLKEGDIVIEMDGEAVLSYDGMISSIRRHLAGDTVAIKVSRDRKPVDLEVSFTKRPEAREDAGSGDGNRRRGSRGANGSGQKRSPFRTWLGGQVPNVQDQQGPDGDENGGVYRSDDAGESWTRINSLNPRPMYFSEIRVDPNDNNNLYVLGIPLYQSSDGGKTFTDDGGKGGVHVDHHAMWIDPGDGRHIILGNDGGLYVTRDRMENWEHLNRFDIGQFYHVGVGPRDDYFVYGGLQDNGSWGGPSRVRRGHGPRNSDWFRVGSGDGFVCLVDPDDANQIYAESQNGGMIRYNLKTGDQSWMRPQPTRGVRYRFNWKTPFILSNHNSKMFYSAGNYVFRSLFKGNRMERISPDITNTDEGSATALTESPRDAKVLYAGTDDGAVWRTKDGGKNWDRLYGVIPSPEESAAEDDAEKKGGESDKPKAAAETDSKTEQKPAAEKTAESGASTEQVESGEKAQATEGESQGQNVPKATETDHPVGGTWKGRMISDQIPAGQGGFELRLTLEEKNVVTGEIDSRMGVGEIVDGHFDPKSNTVRFGVERDEMTIDVTAKINPAKRTMKGELSFAEGQFTMEFEADRTKAAPALAKAESDESKSSEEKKEAEKEPEVDPRTIEPISNLSKLIAGPRWVSSMDASHYENGRVYMTLDGHRSDDDLPYVFVSDDFGETWKSLTKNLPDDVGSAKVIREDIVNPNILYLGTEFSAWVSIDRGETWTSLNSNLPTVAVHEIAQHRTRGEIVAATHGRSLWVLDVTALRQVTDENLSESSQLYKPNTAFLWQDDPSSSETLRAFQGQNPEWGARIFYSFRDRVSKARLIIKDITGEIIKEFDADTTPGLHSILWDLRRDSVGRQRRGFRVAPGSYLVELSVGSEHPSQILAVNGDPEFPEARNFGAEYDEMLEMMEKMNEEEEGVELETDYH